MQPNIGALDRILRLIAGLLIIGLGIYFQSSWGFLGFLLLLTAGFRFCPAYVPFGLSTCATPRGKR